MSHLLQNNKRKSNGGGRNMATFQNELMNVGGGQKIIPPRSENRYSSSTRKNLPTTQFPSNGSSNGQIHKAGKLQTNLNFHRQRTSLVTPNQKQTAKTNQQRRITAKPYRSHLVNRSGLRHESQQQQQIQRPFQQQEQSPVLAEGESLKRMESTRLIQTFLYDSNPHYC